MPFAHFTLTSTLYDIDVPGYKIDTKNRLRLFDLDSVDSSIIEDGINFDKTDIARNLTLFLYPDDSNRQGELLRIFQQYFMVSNGAQLIIDEAIEKGSNLHDLADYAVVQINDTHPSMVIPELIRLLTERGIGMDEAISIVRSMTAYTNHTILAEALEKWPLEFLQEVVPHLVPIIEELDRRVRADYKDPAVQIIDENDRVHMAHMDIHYGFSVNGVAALHTEILKNSELKAFYDIYLKNSTIKQTVSLSVVGSCMPTQPCHTTWMISSDVTGTMTHLNWKTFFLMKIKMPSKQNWKTSSLTTNANWLVS